MNGNQDVYGRDDLSKNVNMEVLQRLAMKIAKTGGYDLDWVTEKLMAQIEMGDINFKRIYYLDGRIFTPLLCSECGQFIMSKEKSWVGGDRVICEECMVTAMHVFFRDETKFITWLGELWNRYHAHHYGLGARTEHDIPKTYCHDCAYHGSPRKTRCDLGLIKIGKLREGTRYPCAFKLPREREKNGVHGTI